MTNGEFLLILLIIFLYSLIYHLVLRPKKIKRIKRPYLNYKERTLIDRDNLKTELKDCARYMDFLIEELKKTDDK